MDTFNEPSAMKMTSVKFLNFEAQFAASSKDALVRSICERFSLEPRDFYLISNGKILLDNNIGKMVHVVIRCIGGKGGFGSMLRAIGAQIEKTTNREACRDLSGRRLRDINEEKRLKNWISQKEEREQEARERKRQKLERLCQEPKVEIKDAEFMKQRLNLAEDLSDSVEKGLKAAAATSNFGSKRKSDEQCSTEPKAGIKKKKIMLLDDIDLDSNSSDDDTHPAAVCSKAELTSL